VDLIINVSDCIPWTFVHTDFYCNVIFELVEFDQVHQVIGFPFFLLNFQYLFQWWFGPPMLLEILVFMGGIQQTSIALLPEWTNKCFFQIACFSIWLRTDFTFKFFHTRVKSSQMTFEIVRLGKWLQTNFTWKWFNSWMNEEMFFQTCQESEWLWANFTSIFLSFSWMT